MRSTLVLPAPEGPASARHSPRPAVELHVEHEVAELVPGLNAEQGRAPRRRATSFTDSRIAADTATSTADRASAESKSVEKRS